MEYRLNARLLVSPFIRASCSTNIAGNRLLSESCNRYTPLLYRSKYEEVCGKPPINCIMYRTKKSATLCAWLRTYYIIIIQLF